MLVTFLFIRNWLFYHRGQNIKRSSFTLTRLLFPYQNEDSSNLPEGIEIRRIASSSSNYRSLACIQVRSRALAPLTIFSKGNFLISMPVHIWITIADSNLVSFTKAIKHMHAELLTDFHLGKNAREAKDNRPLFLWLFLLFFFEDLRGGGNNV